MASSASRVVIIGNGMVSVRLCEALHQRAPGRFAVTVLGEERRAAYDRVKLSSFFERRDAGALSLADPAWYGEHGVVLRTGDPVVAIDRTAATVTTAAGVTTSYDHLVLATGSSAWMPPLEGNRRPGVFVYRTLDDLEAIVTHAGGARRCVVLGGGLLGLEAARAALDLGLETHVIEPAPRLMPRQLDAAGSRLLEVAVKKLGVHLHLGAAPSALCGDGEDGAVTGVQLGDEVIAADLVIVAAGIRPRDELARSAGLEVAPRGGVVVDDVLATSDPRIAAVGEVAVHRGVAHGLVAPGYAMADVLARRLAGDRDARFDGADASAKLKLLGVEVASFGDPFATGDEVRDLVFHDLVRGVYHKLVVTADGSRLLGGILVGDASPWARLTGLARSSAPLAAPPHQLLFGAPAAAAATPDTAVCTCHDVTAGAICSAIRDGGLGTVDDVKRATRAGSGCGGCTPDLTRLLDAELARRGTARKKGICEHFDYTRAELYQIVASLGLRDFDALLAARGRGAGCELCKPVAASLFASVHNEMILDRHAALQDSNDRFLANLQRRGLYSVVPRIPGGEITPEKLIVIGEVAQRYGLYTKITGGQRIDLFGARLEQLPAIWETLVAAGFESGHAYGKAMRTVKSCVGSTWCRYGVQDSVGLAIRLEHRYKGIRAPHKLKSAVSGCVRECAEAQSKDFGVIATERGYNLYVGGNGGSRPRHADLLAADLDEETLIRLIDRFIVFYIRTADKLTRTSVWLGQMEGGLDHLRDVIVHDSLGIAGELEAQMQVLVDSYQCEWAAVVRDPDKRARFRAFANSDLADDTVQWIEERGQSRPADWPRVTPDVPVSALRRRGPTSTRWIEVARIADVPLDGGVAFRHGELQLALFRHGSDGNFYATQQMCPHKHDMVLSRGLLGESGGEPKVACPQHKKTFSLRTGACLAGDVPALRTFPVRTEGERVLVELPPPEALAELAPPRACDQRAAG